jgi:hypothetical protein
MPLSFSFVAASLRPVYCTSFAQGERHPQTHHVISCSCFVMEISKNRCVGLAVLDDADPALDRDRIRILGVHQSE